MDRRGVAITLVFLFFFLLASEALTKVDDTSPCMPKTRKIWQVCVEKVCNDECTSLGFEGGKCYFKIRCDCYTNCD
ncbi:hypothetical protein C4D60_Mb07t25000 [Musa balbisiana]|uniref:Knottin scorpion toxin-like domain-containing protein n=1 Tax=Musa balbisiana TaxID=52838 RepID=A0A4S8JHU0_MUSBA|nr:hypothetical protein C4D60_Mb07t25000 [Musa balbisiana]